MGGLAAVPDGKIAGRTMARLGGTDRWATALLVGLAAFWRGVPPPLMARLGGTDRWATALLVGLAAFLAGGASPVDRSDETQPVLAVLNGTGAML